MYYKIELNNVVNLFFKKYFLFYYYFILMLYLNSFHLMMMYEVLPCSKKLTKNKN